MATTTPTPELLANIFRLELFDSTSLTLADRLAQMLNGENIEIEAKLGTYSIKGERYRIPELEPGFYPLAHNPQPPYQFQSEIPKDRFEYLNKMVLNGRAENYRVNNIDPEVKFIRTHTIDSMYTTNNSNTTIRVTRNMDGEVLACITKQDALPTGPNAGQNGSHINILSNSKDSKGGLDCRISVKREIPSELPSPEAKPFYTREKIRSSYQIGMFSIDLTELPFLNKDGTKVTTYEVEIEFLPQYMPIIKQALADFFHVDAQGKRAPRNGNFVKIVRNLVNTTQTLIKYSIPGAPLPILCRADPLSDEQARRLKKFDSNQSSAMVSLNQGGLAGESRM